MTDCLFQLNQMIQCVDVHKPHASKQHQSQQMSLCDKDHVFVKSCATLSSVLFICITLGLTTVLLSTMMQPFFSETLIGLKYVFGPAVKAFFNTSMEPISQLNACGKNTDALPFSVCKASMSVKLRLTRVFIDFMMCVHSGECTELVADCKQYALYLLNAGISLLVSSKYAFQYLIRPIISKLVPSSRCTYTMICTPIKQMHLLMFNSFTAFYQGVALMGMFMYHKSLLKND